MSERQSKTKIAVTGANGYLGRNLCTFLREHAVSVFELSARASNNSADSFLWRLGEPLPQNFFASHQIDALVHCAYDFSLSSWTDIHRINVEGSIKLLRQAKCEGVGNLVFVSTMSAFPSCKSMYGKAKLEVEEEARKMGASVVRPGLIYSEGSGSMMGKLTQAVRRLPVLPYIFSPSLLYLVDLKDLQQLIFLLATGKVHVEQPIIAAADDGKTFKEILMLIAKREGRNLVPLPVPWQAVWLGLNALEQCGLKPNFRSDSVISLVHQNPSPNFLTDDELQVSFGKYVDTAAVT